MKLPQGGIVKAKIHRLFEGTLKTVTVSRTPSGKFYASLLFDTQQQYPEPIILGKIVGIAVALREA